MTTRTRELARGVRRRPRPNTSGHGWHHGATQPIPVVVTHLRWMVRVRRQVGALLSGFAQDSPAQQRALEHIAMQRLLGR